ncbi:MAG: hypothetical protein LBC65_03460, partial [Oscillospiraceae bacterium]|nr:hypothetical protein [Oscillospiraceae bacterium]
MEIIYIAYFAAGAAAIILVLQLVLLLRKPKDSGLDRASVSDVIREYTREVVTQNSTDNRSLREEVGGQIDRLRDSLNVSLNGANDAQASAIGTMSVSTAQTLDKLRGAIDERFSKSADAQIARFSEQKDGFHSKLDEFRGTIGEKLEELRSTQSESFNAFTRSTSGNLERIR